MNICMYFYSCACDNFKLRLKEIKTRGHKVFSPFHVRSSLTAVIYTLIPLKRVKIGIWEQYSIVCYR